MSDNKMHNPKEEYKRKDEIIDFVPEWMRILKDYFRRGHEKYLQNKQKYKPEDES